MAKKFAAEAEYDGLPNPSGLGILLFVIFAAICATWLHYDTRRSKELAAAEDVKEASEASACLQTRIQEHLQRNEPLQNYQLDNLKAICAESEQAMAKLEQQKNAVSGQTAR